MKIIKMLSKNLKSLRKINGWTQAIAAEKLKVKLPTYQSYEDGRAEPDIERLILIADTYKITVDQLIRKDLTSFVQERIDSKEIERLIKKYPEQFKKK
jgi:transcriptional regulator with XRE-family HTH domain